MPIFLDRHVLAAVPGAVRHQIHLEAMHGLVDPSGTRPLAHWVEDQYFYCVAAAPGAEAFCEHHTSRQLPCDDVHPLEGLRGTRPLTGEEMGIVRTAITAIWHAVPSGGPARN